MQGKERNQNWTLDEQFVDQSWGAMAELLDREMPVDPPPSKKKRYGLLLLLLLLIGFVTGISASYFYLTNDEPTPTKPAPKVPIEDLIIASTNTTNTDDTNYTLTRSGNSGEPNIEKMASSTALSNATDIAISSKTIIPTQQKIKTKTIHSNPTVQSTTNAVAIVETETTPVETSTTTNTLAIEQKEEVVAFRDELNSEKPTDGFAKEVVTVDETTKTKDTEAFETIKSFDLEPLDLPSASIALVTSEERIFNQKLVVVPKQKYDLKLGVMAGGHLAGKVFGGWSIGAVVEKKISPKFALHTGLGFTSLKKNQEFILDSISTYSFEDQFSELTADEPTNVATPVGFSQLIRQLSNEQRMINLKGLNYINVPLMVAYQPSAFLKVMIGINLNYRLNNFNLIGGNLSTDNDGNAEFQNVNNEGVANKSALIDSVFDRGIRKTDIGGILGLGFFPTKNTGIDLRYNFGFYDYSIDQIFQAERHTNSNLQLSLVHYFGH